MQRGKMMQKVIDTALKEVGYLEKKTNAMLDSKTSNAGLNNYTKYGKAQGCNGYAWCDAFVDWCFVQAYGKTMAEVMLGGFSNYTPTSANYFKEMDRYFSTAKKGDVVFFKNTQRICHTGIVYDVKNGMIFTIEGNTSGGTSVVANGGGVFKKSYSIKNSRIAGFGRPNYEMKFDTVKKGDENYSVKVLQKLLNKVGYNCGIADGEYGSRTEEAVLAFKIAYELSSTNTFGQKAWSELLRRVYADM